MQWDYKYFETLTVSFCYFDCLSILSHLLSWETELGFPSLFQAIEQITVQ